MVDYDEKWYQQFAIWAKKLIYLCYSFLGYQSILPPRNWKQVKQMMEKQFFNVNTDTLKISFDISSHVSGKQNNKNTVFRIFL